MRQARTFLPIDLLALVINGRSYSNQAWTRERLGGPSQTSLSITEALDQLLAMARGRHAWIISQGQRLEGLAGTRRRGGRQAWEIDYLIDATAGLDVVSVLLESAVWSAGRSGAERIFLRLEAESQLLQTVREAGFYPYRQESLYVSSAPSTKLDLSLRAQQPADSYPLFKLYNETTPESTRRHEGATFAEWHSSQEPVWLKNGVQLVREQAGAINARARAAPLMHGVGMEIETIKPEQEMVAGLIGSTLRALGSPEAPLYLLATEESGLSPHLEALGFAHCGEYVSLVKRTTRPLNLPKLVPAIAKSAVGA